MKKTLVLSSFIAISFAAFASPRSEEAAREVAYSHFCQTSNAKARNGASKGAITLAATATGILGTDAGAKARMHGSACEPFYVYNNGSDAFVIVSGDDAVEPVLAYGNEGAFVVEGMPEQLRGWLRMYAAEMDYIASASRRTFADAGAAPRKAKAFPSAVAPLLEYRGEKIQWDQNAPFNRDCPSYSGNLCPVGCVATAFAQIMYYHRWPEKGQGGTKNYISEPYSFSQSFNYSATTFDFGKMLPHYYYGKYSDEQGAEAAKLCHGIGVAVEMMYEPGGSGAYSVLCGDPVIKYFNYDKNLHYANRDYFTQEEWIDMIKTELSAGRPICYAGSSTSVGHQFVFDGYDEADRVHVNWGWAGMSDGYFALSALSPSDTGTGGGSVTSGGFIYNQAMWLGMQRPTDASSPVSHLVINTYSAIKEGYSDQYLRIDKMNAMAGENITLSIEEIVNLSTSFSGVLGIVIEGEDGQQTVLSSSASKSIRCATYFKDDAVLTQTGVIPDNIADGNYTIYFASKAEGELRWSRIRAAESYCDHYDMNVSGGMVSFSYNGEPDADGTLVADHTIYTKCRSQFTARIRNNNSREFFGIARVGIYSEAADGTASLVAICGREQVILPKDKEVEIVFKGSIEAPKAGTTVSQGNYKACVIVESQGKYYQVSESIDIKINRIPTGMASLTCEDFTPSKTSYGIDEPIEGHIQVTNTQSVYSNFIGVIIFKEKSNSGVPYWEQEVFLEKGKSAEYSFCIPAQFEPGNYKASLRYTGSQEYSNEIKTFTFEVRDEYVSVSSPAEDGSVIRSEYFSLAGQRLAGEPKKGAYIIRTHTAGGTRTEKRIVR